MQHFTQKGGKEQRSLGAEEQLSRSPSPTLPSLHLCGDRGV